MQKEIDIEQAVALFTLGAEVWFNRGGFHETEKIRNWDMGSYSIDDLRARLCGYTFYAEVESDDTPTLLGSVGCPVLMAYTSI